MRIARFYLYAEIDFGVQKTDKFIINGWFSRQKYGTHILSNCWNVCEANLRSVWALMVHTVRTAVYLQAPLSTPTPYNNEKIVIIVVKCDKSYAVLMCTCPVAPYVSLLAFTLEHREFSRCGPAHHVNGIYCSHFTEAELSCSAAAFECELR